MEVIVGFFIAVTVGITGIGGGSFTTPALVLLAGMTAGEAVGTAMVFAAVLRLIAAPFYVVRRHVNARYLGLLLLGAIPGLLIGIWLLHMMRSRSWTPVALLLIGLMLTISSALTFVPGLRQRYLSTQRSGWLSLFALPLGVETGFSSAGAGALGTILLLNFSELSAPVVVGTDLLLGIALAVVGSAFHLTWGSINSSVLLRLLAGGIPGVLFGCMLAKRVPAERLRTAVAAVAIALGLQLIWMSGAPLVRSHARQAMREETRTRSSGYRQIHVICFFSVGKSNGRCTNVIWPLVRTDPSNHACAIRSCMWTIIATAYWRSKLG
jgi:uncharacterized protein